MAYSEDLRKKVIGYLEKGHSQRETAQVYGISMSTVNEWHQHFKKTGSIKKKPLNRTFKKPDPEKLMAYVSEHPDAYLREIGDAFGCSDTAVLKAFSRLGITRKKGARGSLNKSLSR